MRSLPKIILLIFLLSVALTPGVQAAAFSQEFQIRVILPAIVGVNVDEERNLLASQNKEKLSQYQITTEDAIRNNHKVRLRTIVPK